MGDADALHLAFVIKVVEDPVGHDGDIAFLPLRCSPTGRGIFEGDELGVKLHEDLVALGEEVAHFQDLLCVGCKRLVVSDELLGAMEGLRRGIGAIGAIEVLHGDIRCEIAGDFIKPLVVEVVDVFQVLLAIHC